MHSRFTRGTGRLKSDWLILGLAALAAILILPATALAAPAKSTNQLSVLGIGALLLFVAGAVALVLLVEKRNWPRKHHRALGVVVFIGLVASLLLLHDHHHFIVVPMLGCLLLIGGFYALYSGMWKQPMLEFWPWNHRDHPNESDDDRWKRRDREIKAHNQKLLKHRLQYAAFTIVGLVGGTVLMAVSNAHLVW